MIGYTLCGHYTIAKRRHSLSLSICPPSPPSASTLQTSPFCTVKCLYSFLFLLTRLLFLPSTAAAAALHCGSFPRMGESGLRGVLHVLTNTDAEPSGVYYAVAVFFLCAANSAVAEQRAVLRRVAGRACAWFSSCARNKGANVWYAWVTRACW